MKIDVGDYVTLDDDTRYLVVGKTFFGEKDCFCLSDSNKADNIMFCFQEDDKLIEIEDKDAIKELLVLFANNIINNN